MISVGDVVAILEMLAGEGISVWIDGGWGVDALLGHQTRDHDDLDIVLEAADAERFTAAVEDAGFRTIRVDGPGNWVVGDDANRRIDVHLVDTGALAAESSGRAVHGGEGLAYPVGSLDGMGTIGGVAVRCLTAEYQVESHTGYEIDATDVADVMALHERFGVALPGEYEGRR